MLKRNRIKIRPKREEEHRKGIKKARERDIRRKKEELPEG